MTLNFTRWPVAEPILPAASERHKPHRHESTDVSPAYIGLFALGLILMIVLVLLVLDWTMRRFEAVAERSDPVASPVAGDQTPPEPRLQADPAADLARLRREEDRKLTSYAWANRKEGKVRLPIDRAIDILAERGLPEPKGPVELPRREEPTP
jgi:hypothetical protein